MADLNEKTGDVESSSGTPPPTTDVNKEKLEASTIAPPPVGVDHIVTKDGMRLHPQPTSDPLDPLNWTFLQKHSILAIIMFFYFMFTYITTTTVPSFPDLQETYNITYSQVNWTVAIPALGLAVGPLIWSSLADIYGRRVIFLIGTIIAFASTIGAAKASDYGGYMAARFFQGFGVSPASTVGLAAINDMFYEHERGQKIGLWVLSIDAGLLVGPIFGGFLNIVSAEWIQWFCAILFGVMFVLELMFMPETLYPRNHMLTKMPMITSSDGASAELEKVGRRRSNSADVDVPRTKKLPFVNYKPVPGMRHPKPWDALLRTILLFKFLPVTIAIFAYCFLWYWWVLSVITMLPAAYLSYTPQIQGLLFIGLLLGTLFAEVFLGGRLSDFICAKLAKNNNGIRVPEMRLWLIYPAGVLTAIGLIIWGISVDKNYHWIVGQIAFFLFAAGIQMGNTVVCAYVVDAYPLQSMSVITFYAVFLNLSAFADPFFIAPWQATSGWTWCFAAQGIIVAFGALPAFAALHKFGPKLRNMSGQPSWVNPEFDTFLN
ncbi:putative transporter [Cyphellophora attinorum]|uniref:Putative transporter n=1 Tax=Cyphellophora attinorum TaxID=1664694 RepID=A0A0N0NLK2_9EURO|nr:putative transporter [Phialophora attinorum]KPI39129.1 putative transporter [Phialophora attinorum]